MATKIKWPKAYSEHEIIWKFKNLTPEKQNKILEKALKLALEGRAGTRSYAIASSMGYVYQDDGSYTK